MKPYAVLPYIFLLLITGCKMNNTERDKSYFLKEIEVDLGKKDESISQNECVSVYKSKDDGICFYSKLPPEEAANELYTVIKDTGLHSTSTLRQDYSVYTATFQNDSKTFAFTMSAYTIEDSSPDNDKKIFWPWKSKGYRTRIIVETFDK